jgi:hypothetical protein
MPWSVSQSSATTKSTASLASLHTSASVSMRQHTSAYQVHRLLSLAAYVNIRQHASAYVSILSPPPP